MARKIVFTLTSGRSGTMFLCGLLRHNARNCLVVHEPYLYPGNPTMFGLPIYDHLAGNLGAIRKLVKQKHETIKRYRSAVYIETSHAFLKSYWDIAPEFFPRMKVLHLIRHPLEVARSEANRETLARRWRLPLHYYRGRDGRKYFRWALTGREPIFGSFDLKHLTLFQRYLTQWIEIENRAIAFLARFNMTSSCVTLHSPWELKEPQSIMQLLHFLDLEPISERVLLTGIQNRTPGKPTVVGDEERRQCREVMERIPAQYLEIFQYEPYTGYQWNGLLQK